MNRQFSLAGLLRLRQIQQDQAASGPARARSRSSSVRARGRARRQLSATDEPHLQLGLVRAVAAARSSSHSMLADLQNLTRLAEADEAKARAEFIAARYAVRGAGKAAGPHYRGQHRGAARRTVRPGRDCLDALAPGRAAGALMSLTEAIGGMQGIQSMIAELSRPAQRKARPR